MAILDRIQLHKATTFQLGVTKISKDQVQIAVWQPRVSRCQLCLYQHGQKQKIAMPPMREFDMGDVFAVILSGEQITERMDGLEYDFIVDGSHIPDPYAKAVSGREHFGRPKKHIRGKFDFSEFDWTGENRKTLAEHEMVMYQCHVRGFTRHASSGVEYPGTFAGLQEKIPYLKELGVNTLLPLPFYDFDECIRDKEGVATGRVNYWGYIGDAFYFAPKTGYSSRRVSASEELKQLVRALHQNGMNLIMDMYFADRTPEFILQCLRYYVLEFHVDGFRINQESMDTSWLRLDPVLS
ncbi:MAG: alpha-amylase family glycosyl hydrolase, partial [Roseburia sp.]|nr:alpha-amylase family glycosyl hydrolase [Roseburia sp.]